ncbi:MAG TPA: pH regulation protein F [Pseudomonadaceae bacterium]|nr:pH regulation protein F [Pseudomonadaceae bacterium]
MFIAITIAILVVMSLALIRALLGPTLYDRILAVNMVGTKTVLLICVMSVVAGRGDMVDIALVYALINFIGIIAVLRFLTARARRDEA